MLEPSTLGRRYLSARKLSFQAAAGACTHGGWGDSWALAPFALDIMTDSQHQTTSQHRMATPSRTTIPSLSIVDSLSRLQRFLIVQNCQQEDRNGPAQNLVLERLSNPISGGLDSAYQNIASNNNRFSPAAAELSLPYPIPFHKSLRGDVYVHRLLFFPSR